MKLSGKVRIEFRHKDTGIETRSPLQQNNLIFNSTYLSLLGASPIGVFAGAVIYISSQTTPPSPSDTASTGVLADGFVPGGVTSPIWYESVEPNFGEIQNQINAPAADRIFYTVGLRRGTFGSPFYCATLLSIPCTQAAFEVLIIYYRIQVQNTDGQRLSSRFTRDFGGAIFSSTSGIAIKDCYHYALGTSYCDPPTSTYIDSLQSQNLINFNSNVNARNYWGATTIASHYKYKEFATFQIAQSSPPGTDEFIGLIFNSMLTGYSNTRSPGSNFVAGSYTENTASAYRISKYNSQTVNINPLLPVFQPPFQKIWSHRTGAPLPFFDVSNAAIGSSYPTPAGAWTGRWPELYRYTITLGGALGVATYKFSRRYHLGFNGNSYSDRLVSCPFRNPNTPSATGMHGWRNEDNDLLRYSNTQIVQYDATGVTLLDLMNGDYTHWDATTTPVLNVTALRQCAVDTTNGLIYCACRNTGLWIIDVINSTTIQQVATPCYGVDVGRNNVAWAIFEGFLRNSSDWVTDSTFSYTGLTNGLWARAFFLKADPEDVSDRLAIVIDSPGTPGTTRRVVWYDFATTTTSTGLDSASVRQWAASLDVADTGSFWAISGLRLNFGLATTSAIASPPSQSLTHSIWGSVALYKIAFYNGFLITTSAIVNSSNIFQNTYTAIGTTAAVLHLQGGITVFTNALRQLFTDNIYPWEDYGWDGSTWVLGNTNSKITHATDDALIQGLTVMWTEGANAPFFQSGDFYTQGILNGTWKDNATTIYYENFWYSKAVHFDETLSGGLTVPASPPYEIPFPAASDPLFLRIETDSVNELNKFTLNGGAIATIYTSGEAPGPNELTITPTGAGAKATFNASDAGKTWEGSYSWIEV